MIIIVGLFVVAVASPLQFFYDDTTLASESKQENCVLRSWNGTDATGLTGPPWITTINCSEGNYTVSGVATANLMVYFGHDTMGDSYWVAAGTMAKVTIEGFAYVVGGTWTAAEEETTTFLAPRTRVYRSLDATNIHDAHIGNGSTNSRDLTFSKGVSGVDPPAVTVINCAYDDSPDLAFVWWHLHPGGAVYLPYTGRICFQANDVKCAEPGAPRWVSPNLAYYEYFEPRDTEPAAAAAAAKDLVLATFDATNASKCEHPIVFSVTNLDPDDPAGQPTFDDLPNGTAHWGYFKSMTARLTTAHLGVARVEAP